MKVSLTTMRCKEARKNFASLADNRADMTRGGAVREHVNSCARCAEEYRLFSLGRTVLDLAGSREAVTPDKDFYAALRARIARGPAPLATSAGSEDFWANALWATARQLIPAMAMLLLLIIGATLMWSNHAAPQDPSLDAQYKVRGMTADDMLDTIVAEERLNGR